MAKSSDRTVPPTPTTDHALPPAGETASADAASGETPSDEGTSAGVASREGASSAVESSGARAVPGPSESGRGSVAVDRPRPYTNGRPDSPGEMRREIQDTRDRLSGTLDALEARIVYEKESLERKKDEIVDKATLKPLRQRLTREPWRAVAIAFVAGYITAALRD